MRVLLVTQYFWPENFRINDLAAEWQRRGYSVTVLTGRPNYPGGKVFPEYQEHPEDFAEYNGCEIIRIPVCRRGNGGFRLFLNYLSFVISGCTFGLSRTREMPFDVIFVYEPSPITVALPAILIGKTRKTPVVLWVLDLWPETLSAVGVIESRLVLRSIGSLVTWIYNQCTLVLGQSRGFVEAIAKRCKVVEKVHYFPSWSEDVHEISTAELAPEVTESAQHFDILFAGNIGESQDMQSVLEAATILKDDTRVRWLIVGDGRKSAWLEQEVRSRGLSSQVLLLGRYPVERMPSFFAHADALLVSLKPDPVFSLTIPAKVQAYLAAGVPILGMLDGEGAEVIRRSGGGIASPAGDPTALAESVRVMMSLGEEQRLRMGNCGREYSRREFGRELLMNRLESYLAEASRTPGRRVR